MSNDLISRKKAIFFVRSVFDGFGVNAGHKSRADFLIKTLKNMPTAYDVDKVVERLEVNSMFAQADDEPFVMLDDAVEIVKSGGIAEEEKAEWKEHFASRFGRIE